MIEREGTGSLERNQRTEFVETDPLIMDTLQVSYTNLPSTESADELQQFLDSSGTLWSTKEEDVVRRKIDVRVLSWLCVMFFVMQINRISIQNVITTSFLEDLGLTQADYSTGQTIYTVAFMIFEIPSQVMQMVVGPVLWLPLETIIFGISAFSQTFVNSKTTHFICRACLGGSQGGYIPGLSFYLTSFYKTSETSLRVAIFWMTMYITNALSALLSTFIFQSSAEQASRYHDWQILFALEGLFTIGIGIISFFMLPSLQSHRISRIFTTREENILRARVILDDRSKSVMFVPRKRLGRLLSKFKLSNFRETFTDVYLLYIFLLGIIGFLPSITSYHFLTIIFHSDLGYSTTEANLLVIPGNLLLVLSMVTVARICDQRHLHFIAPLIAMAWVIPPLAVLIALPATTAATWIRTICVTLLVGFPYYTPTLISWISANSNDAQKRGLAIAIYNVCVQIGNIIAVNTYRQSDKPYYRVGNIGLVVVSIITIGVTMNIRKLYLSENRKRSMIWDSMTDSQRDDYIRDVFADPQQPGNERFDFRLKL
ncbi:major facilitator superfamily domain-containing protein [Lipomyces oligophaga]|uniref:major facilitator superfamily domain-containing protein n=1 Tax=Lipomyces oligophaga TaxID=45792 RepID=UPI0034CE8ADF